MTASVPEPVIDLLILLDAAGELPVLRELLVLFLATADPLYLRLTEALHNGNTRAAHHASHALRGTTVLIGAHTLSALLSQIEQGVRQDGNTHLPAMIPQMDALFAEVMRQVQAALNRYDTPAGFAYWQQQVALRLP